MPVCKKYLSFLRESKLVLSPRNHESNLETRLSQGRREGERVEGVESIGPNNNIAGIACRG